MYVCRIWTAERCASHPHYSWSPHQHISSLCKHNKSKVHPQVTYTVSGFHSGCMKVWFWLTQKQHRGHEDRHSRRIRLSYWLNGEKKQILCLLRSRRWSLPVWLVDDGTSPCLLLSSQFELWCCTFSPSCRLRRVRVNDSVYERSNVCGKSGSCDLLCMSFWCRCTQLFATTCFWNMRRNRLQLSLEINSLDSGTSVTF